MREAELNVGIPCQVKLGERKMESDYSFPMLHCSVEPRSRAELIWKKEMIAIIITGEKRNNSMNRSLIVEF